MEGDSSTSRVDRQGDGQEEIYPQVGLSRPIWEDHSTSSWVSYFLPLAQAEEAGVKSHAWPCLFSLYAGKPAATC